MLCNFFCVYKVKYFLKLKEKLESMHKYSYERLRTYQISFRTMNPKVDFLEKYTN